MSNHVNKQLTLDEEADEIIRRLKTPLPSRRMYYMPLEIIRQEIIAPSRKLTAIWRIEEGDLEEVVRKKPETEEEEAEEIIRRLKSPPRRNIDVEKELIELISMSIAKDLDKALLVDLLCQQKK